MRSILPTLLLFACSSSTPSPNDALPCEAAAVEVGEGGRIEFVPPPNLTEVQGTAAIAVEGDLAKPTLHANYGSAGTHEVQLKCASRSGKLQVKVRAMRWRTVASWQDGDAAYPLAREYGATWIDPKQPDRMFLLGGFTYRPTQFTPSSDLWTLDLNSNVWSQLQVSGVPAHPGARVVPSGDGTSAALIGGVKSADRGDYATEMYQVDYTTSTPLLTRASTMGVESYLGAIFFNKKRNAWINACGGSTCKPVEISRDLSSIQPLAMDGASPGYRNGMAYAYDEQTERLFVFGGQGKGVLGDTWVLDLRTEPATWTEMFAGEGPSPRRNPGFAHDVTQRRLFVWGGTPDGKTSVEDIQILDMHEGKERWSSVKIADSPEARTSAFGAFDAARNRVILGSGNNAGGIRADTYALEL